MLIGVYLVFKVTTSYEKLHQDNSRSTERYMILWDVVKLFKILEIVVISTQRDNFWRSDNEENEVFRVKYKNINPGNVMFPGFSIINFSKRKA